MYLNYKTEYTYGAVYAPLEKVVEKAASMANYAGIADLCNTYGHVRWSKACKTHGIKPIFGVQLPVVDSLEKKDRNFPYDWVVFLAKNNTGLQRLYKLVDIAHKQFFWMPRLDKEQASFAAYPDLVILEKEIKDIPLLNNHYIDLKDQATYEAFADEFKLERSTEYLHIPTKQEYLAEFAPAEFGLLREIADQCNAELPQAPMTQWTIPKKKRKYVINNYDLLEDTCVNSRLSFWGSMSEKEVRFYEQRLFRELKVIKEKRFEDYFLIVADLVAYAKTKMLVGPARGSAAGSLVCYLLGITEVDPLKYGLYFERFIDLNRLDLPDIDIDFPKNKRHLVTKYLEKKYGKDSVAQIANIGRLKPKSALNRVAKNLQIPLNAVEEVKAMDSDLGSLFRSSEPGKKLIEQYPAMQAAADLEGHASYIGKHAAGILVCNGPVSKYCGINSRDKQRLAMIDKRDAEALNLLKIDALGLRTLDIIEEACETLGQPYSWIYELPLDDPAAYKILNDRRFDGIFQFEGDAVQSLAKKMPLESIEDISALSALGRPGPLGSGAAWDYVHARAGRKEIKWVSEHPIVKAATEETQGVIVYQEQVMRIVRELAGFSWADTGDVRKVIAKSKGDELDKFHEQFIAGAMNEDMSEMDAERLWKAMKDFGGYAFNKSHSVSYGLISYYCAYLKAHYPLEFTQACLNHAKDENSALKILRDAVENEGILYRHIDMENSIQKWSFKHEEPLNDSEFPNDKIFLGGFLSIKGIGPAGANKIVKLRAEGKPYPPGIQKHLDADISPFKYLYPAKELYGHYYSGEHGLNLGNPVRTIKQVKANNGEFNFIGKLTELKPRDLNEPQFVAERNGAFLSSNTSYVIFTLEDDTDSIRCKINAKDYRRLGRQLVEEGSVDEDWYLVYGVQTNDWNIVFVRNLMKITRSYND